MKSVLFGFLMVTSFTILAQGEKFILMNSSVINSLNPDDEKFGDLKPISDAIGDSRIIILSEPSHGDGAAFLFKTRLIKYLHQVHGFNVITWEAGQYDMNELDKSIGDTISMRNVEDKGMLSFWKYNEQTRPLMEYVRETKKTSTPITMAGFDPQLTAFDKMNWVNSLTNFIDSAKSGILDTTFKKKLTEGYATVYSRKGTKDSEGELSALLDFLLSVYKNNRETFLMKSGKEMTDFMEQTIIDQQVQRRYMYELIGKTKFEASMNNPRDKRMAENIIWQANEKFRGKKIIVWIATLHAIYDPQEPRDSTGYAITGLINSGSILKKKFGNKVYHIAFTAAGGMYGNIYQKQPTPIKPVIDNSFEDILNKQPGSIYFTNIRSKSKTFRTRIMGYEYYEADWSRQVDGIVFFREMTPCKIISY